MAKIAKVQKRICKTNTPSILNTRFAPCSGLEYALKEPRV
jgi:hypothetical protein